MKISKAQVESAIEEDSSLWTLKRVDIDEVMQVLEEHHPDLDSEDQLFVALLDVMYKTRPTGPL